MRFQFTTFVALIFIGTSIEASPIRMNLDGIVLEGFWESGLTYELGGYIDFETTLEIEATAPPHIDPDTGEYVEQRFGPMTGDFIADTPDANYQSEVVSESGTIGYYEVDSDLGTLSDPSVWVNFYTLSFDATAADGYEDIGLSFLTFDFEMKAADWVEFSNSDPGATLEINQFTVNEYNDTEGSSYVGESVSSLSGSLVLEKLGADGLPVTLAPVPLPASGALVLGGVAMLGMAKRRARRKKAFHKAAA